MSFPIYQQPDHMDCGPTCLRMVARYHGRAVALDELRKRSETTCKLPQDQVRGIVETHNTPELWDNEKEQMDGSADRSDAARA